MLSQPGWVAVFRSTRFLIVDELHALAENKRGALMMVTAERLEELVTGIVANPTPENEEREIPGSASSQSAGHAPKAELKTIRPRLTRIGLSATVAPLETVAV